jgi:hypothetical protein
VTYPSSRFSSNPPPHRGHGHRTTPDAKARRFGAAHPTSAAAAFPPAGALRRFRCAQQDQGQTETCYGHATSVLVYVAFAAYGTPLAWVPSPLGIARSALAEEQPLKLNPLLVDSGADMADVMTGIGREGVRPMGPLAPLRFSDVTPETIQRRPTLAEDEAGARDIVLGPEALLVGAADFLAQIATSIANLECGVSLGIHDSPAFSNWTAGSPAVSDLSGFTDADGHDVACLDYRTNPTTGELEFWLLSSWGAWGEEGGAWVSGSWLVGGGVLEAWRMAVLFAASSQVSP